MTIIHDVETARTGNNPAVICRMPSGWAVLCNMQYLKGYTILLPDPVVPSINNLGRPEQAAFLCDMVTVGDALMEVTGAYRINYFLGGNSDPYLHSHIVPRYMSEPEEIRRGGPWSYPKELMDANLLDARRDKELMAHLAEAIKKRL
jgi:diadenosine tetraphosphate (Ap4A) HIT family hydrolase